MEEGQLGIGEELHVELVDMAMPHPDERAVFWLISEPPHLVVWLDDKGNIVRKQYVEYK